MPTPDVLQVSDDFRAALRARETQAVRDMTTAYTKVSTRLVREGERLAAEVARLRAAGEAVPPWRVAQLERYRDLMTQTQAELGRLGTASAETIAELQQEGLNMGMDMAEAQVLSLIPSEIAIGFNRLPVGALESMIGFLADGSPLARLLAELGTESAGRIGEFCATAWRWVGIRARWRP